MQYDDGHSYIKQQQDAPEEDDFSAAATKGGVKPAGRRRKLPVMEALREDVVDEVLNEQIKAIVGVCTSRD